MKADAYTKAILTVIAILLAWNLISRPARADDATLDDISNQVADVGSAVDDLQKSVADMADDIADIKNNGCDN